MVKDNNTEESLVKEFDSGSKKKPMPKILILATVMILLGIGSGFLIAKGTATNAKTSQEQITNVSQVDKGTTMGSNDTATFKDTAEGVLKEGGIEGEGQFHLERPGGASQSVYLFSSAVDLSILKGKKIKVWGQTQKAQHAGWLMDVGRIEVL